MLCVGASLRGQEYRLQRGQHFANKAFSREALRALLYLNRYYLVGFCPRRGFLVQRTVDSDLSLVVWYGGH